jgi:hypothetical protein
MVESAAETGESVHGAGEDWFDPPGDVVPRVGLDEVQEIARALAEALGGEAGLERHGEWPCLVQDH